MFARCILLIKDTINIFPENLILGLTINRN